jgi:energy-coupling factor transporter ATP-binding protein EcfA2
MQPDARQTIAGGAVTHPLLELTVIVQESRMKGASLNESRIEKEILRLVQSIAPPSFLENPDSVEYLSNLLALESRSSENDLVDVICQFIGEEHDCESRMIAKAVMELPQDTEEVKNSNESYPNRTKAFSLIDKETSETIHNVDNLDHVVDEKSSTKGSPKGRSKVKKGPKNDEDGPRSMKAKVKDAKTIQALAAAELEELDDHASAWEECLAEGKTWGGRGLGGRGLRSMYTSTTARVTSVHLQNVSLQFAGNDLLQNATIQITEKKRYGLIGRNGVGKSVLLRRLAAKSIPGFPIQMKVLFVRQEVEGSTTMTALQTLLDADEERMVLLEEQKKLEEMLDSSDPEVVTDAAQQLSELTAELDLHGGDNAEDTARDILKGLQFTNNMIDSPTEHLSGGWKMRLALAQVLFVRSDLLLLGE